MRIAMKMVYEGECIPRGYGIAWHDYNTLNIVCFPIPFNWLASWARDLWYFVVRGREDAIGRAAAKMHARRERSYAQVWLDGWDASADYSHAYIIKDEDEMRRIQEKRWRKREMAKGYKDTPPE